MNLEAAASFARRNLGFAILFLLMLFGTGLFLMLSTGGAALSPFNPYLVLVGTLVNGLWAGLVIYLIEKYGTHVSLNKQLENINDRTEDIGASMENLFKLDREHGFAGISNNVSEHREIDEVQSGEIYWLNTVFQNPVANMSAIMNAVKRGVNVKLLMMHPENEHRVVRGRYTCPDPSDPANVEASIRAYEDRIKTTLSQIEHHYVPYRNAADRDGWGKLEVRLYKDPAGLPLFMVKDKDHTRAKSGFYITGTSGQLPQISWNEIVGKTPFIEKLADYFDKKWKFAEDGSMDLFLEPPSLS